MSDRLTFYRDPAGDHRWRLAAPNGRVIGQSSEGYRRRGRAVANALRVVGDLAPTSDANVWTVRR